MTATKLMEILQKYEFGGATGKPRRVDVTFNDVYGIFEPDVEVTEFGDGCVGAEMTINFKGENHYVCDGNTLGDYIRGMTNKELAQFIDNVVMFSSDKDIAFPYKEKIMRFNDWTDLEERLGEELEDDTDNN